MSKDLFPIPDKYEPKIYAYEEIAHPNQLKIGFTTRKVIDRVAEQYPILRPDQTYKIVFEQPAVSDDGRTFTDKDVHRILRQRKIENTKGEWFKCNVTVLEEVYIALKTNSVNEENRIWNFELRPEQLEAIKKTQQHFNSYINDNPNKTPHFLWNAKMRFGKTFASYKLAQEMGWKRILVITFKPAVKSAWEEDITLHKDFEGWQFISRNGLSYENADKEKQFVCFGSFQDILGRNENGGIKKHNEWIHSINWDCVILDEYHFGAWREGAKELFKEEEKETLSELEFLENKEFEIFDEEEIPISSNHYLYLSGTPFRAIATGEFIEEQIYNWTYSDEQRAKINWADENPNLANPYEILPQMVMMTYQMPDAIRSIALNDDYNEFDLNTFFKASGNGEAAEFKYKTEVQKWLDLIRGNLLDTLYKDIRSGNEKPPMPFSDARLIKILNHTFWFLPSVSSCYAMANLFKEHQNIFYHDYKIIVVAGKSGGIGLDAYKYVIKEMGNPLATKSITLSCGKLTTGVSVKPWSGMFMLRNLSSPETYFQSAFRVQTPWVIDNPDNLSPNKKEIIKKVCYIFDFAPNRALKQISDYSCRLDTKENKSPEQKVEEFINFLPVLAYDGSAMRRIDAAGILDMAMSGTTATLLARRWESALLVNVDNNTLSKLMANEEAMKALTNIEGFRNLNQDIETIINKSVAVKKAKKENLELSIEKKRQLTAEEKEYVGLRKQIQDKLIKFATRIPIFMYLTDYREHTLKDVITQLEPDLFKKVTGITQQDFELLESLNVFNGPLMNDAIFKFKRYEDASLEYTGINKHVGKEVGGYNTVKTYEEFHNISTTQ